LASILSTGALFVTLFKALEVVDLVLLWIVLVSFARLERMFYAPKQVGGVVRRADVTIHLSHFQHQQISHPIFGVLNNHNHTIIIINYPL